VFLHLRKQCLAHGITRSLVSDALERSNFLSMLHALGGESETVLVVRWSVCCQRCRAVGWVREGI